jgi:hypothetical protein
MHPNEEFSKELPSGRGAAVVGPLGLDATVALRRLDLGLGRILEGVDEVEKDIEILIRKRSGAAEVGGSCLDLESGLEAVDLLRVNLRCLRAEAAQLVSGESS